MKRFFSSILFTLTIFICNGQFNIGANVGTSVPPKDLELLKASETIFVCRDQDDVKQMQEVVNSVWTITKMTVVPYSTFLENSYSGYSVIALAGLTSTVTASNTTAYSNTHLFLKLGMEVPHKKNKTKELTFCRIEMHPGHEDIKNLREKNVINYFYEEGQLKNWSPGLIKIYFKFLNDHLLAEEKRWLFKVEEDKKQLIALKRATLYVPDYVISDNAKVENDAQFKSRERLLFSKYSFKHEVISMEALNDMILEAEEPFYFMLYIRSSTDKFINVFNGLTGELVYSHYAPISYKIKDKDLDRLTYKIKK